MMPNDPTLSHDALDSVIAGYMLAVEGGDVPNRQELLDRHPEHADALRTFFADLDRMDRVASPLRLADGPEMTGPADVNRHAVPPTVRYFGDYELLEEVARGGMGIVYKARQVSLNRQVALKMILAGCFASSRDVQRFRTEAEAAANLDHPHLVPIYEVGEHEGQQYYTMKFVEGTSLAKHAKGDARTEVAGLIPVARAVHHAHQHGVLHRDLKPSNVLVDPQGSWFVTDFGLAKRLAGADRSLTESGQILGTPRYMAPEQAAGRKDLTVLADVYSLGVILYERLTGRTPFAGEDALTLLRQVRESEPPRPSSILPGLNRDLETVVLKCLDKDPGRRYASAAALADDLDRWLAGKPITARPSGSVARAWKWARRNPTVAGLLASVGLLLVALLVGSIVAAVRLAAAARSSRGLYLAAQSELVRPSDPGLALVLAVEGADGHPGPIANNATLAAMDANYELRTLVGHGQNVNLVSISPDGRRAVTSSVSGDSTAWLWDLDSGRAVMKFEHDAPPIAARFTPDGQRLVTFSTMFHSEGGSGSTYFDSGSPMEPQLRRWSPKVQVFDLASGRRSAQWIEPVSGRLSGEINAAGAMDLSRDGRRVVVTSGFFPGHPPRIIDLDRGNVVELRGHDGPVVAVAFAPDGGRVATASADRTARIWDSESGQELEQLKGHVGPVTFVAFSPDGRRLLTLAPVREFDVQHKVVLNGRLWDVETGAVQGSLHWPQPEGFPDGGYNYGCPRLTRFGPSGNEIYTAGITSGFASGSDPINPAVWDAASGKLLRSLRREARTQPLASDLAVSADGRRIAIGYSDGEVRVVDSSDRGPSPIRAKTYGKDGRRSRFHPVLRRNPPIFNPRLETLRIIMASNSQCAQ